MAAKQTLTGKLRVDEFRVVPRVSVNGTQLRSIYQQADTARFFYPECNVRENNYIRFRQFLTATTGFRLTLEGDAQSDGGVRAVLAIVEFNRERDRATVIPLRSPPAPREQFVGTENDNSERAITPIARSPLAETDFLFEQRDVVLKVGDDRDIESEVEILKLLEKRLGVTRRTPHISKLFKELECTLDPKFFEKQAWPGFAKNVERLRATRPFRVRTNPAGDQRLYRYVMTEYSTRGDLFRLMSARNPKQTITLREARSWFFQLLFTLEQMHFQGMIHRDLSANNVTITKNRSEGWLTQYSVFSGEHSQKTGKKMFDFFDPFEGSSDIDVVKIIDVESLRVVDRERLLPVRRPTTTLTTRPPEQLLASMRKTSKNAPDHILPQHSGESDLFSLGAIAADLYLRAATGRLWSVLFTDIAEEQVVEKEAMRSIRQVIANFQSFASSGNQRALRVDREAIAKGREAGAHKRFLQSVDIESWTVRESRLLIYIQNLVYLLGAPLEGDLVTIGVGGSRDYLWQNLFNRFDKFHQPQLKPLLLRNGVPEDAVNAIEGLMRWKPFNRTPAIDLLTADSVFAPYYQGRATKREYAGKLDPTKRFSVFGDAPFDRPVLSDVARKRKGAPQTEQEAKVARVEEMSLSASGEFQMNVDVDDDDDDGLENPVYCAHAVKERAEQACEEESGEILPDIPYVSRDTYEAMSSDERASYTLLQSTDTTLHRCSHCLRTLIDGYKCKQCGSAFYCNRNCQTYHWKYVHKYECRATPGGQ